MMSFFEEALRILYAAILMGAVVFVAVTAESLHYKTLSVLDKRAGRSSARHIQMPFGLIKSSFTRTVILPEGACVPISLYGPVFVFSAFLPVCASVPFCTPVPLLDNGSDILQMFQFFLTSEALAIISIASISCPSAHAVARRMAKDAFDYMLPLVSGFASIAWYFNIAEPDADPFSLSSLSFLLHEGAMGLPGIVGALLFILLIITHVPHNGSGMGCALFSDGELAEYQGCQRTIMQIWGMLRSYIIIALVVYSIFPWDYLKSQVSGAAISWWFQALNLLLFWLTVIAVRFLPAPLCWRAAGYLEKRFSANARLLLAVALAFAAIALVVGDAVRLSLDAAAF